MGSAFDRELFLTSFFILVFVPLGSILDYNTYVATLYQFNLSYIRPASNIHKHLLICFRPYSQWNEKAGIKLLGSEWKTVKPKDKELISYSTRRCAKEGYNWDPETGVAIERSSKTGNCDLGMSRLTIDGSERGRQPRDS